MADPNIVYILDQASASDSARGALAETKGTNNDVYHQAVLETAEGHERDVGVGALVNGQASQFKSTRALFVLMKHEHASQEAVVTATRTWLERAVIGLQLCPFAKAVHAKEQIRYVVSTAQSTSELRDALKLELRTLAELDASVVDTTLLIHPQVLTDFLDYNDFLAVADATVEDLGLQGVVQIASFHPAYQFVGTSEHDVTNFTNRSPYPMLQLLREASVSKAVAAFPDAQNIYRRNLETMRRLGPSGWAALDVGAPVRTLD